MLGAKPGAARYVVAVRIHGHGQSIPRSGLDVTALQPFEVVGQNGSGRVFALVGDIVAASLA
jgi:hypothetical protein